MIPKVPPTLGVCSWSCSTLPKPTPSNLPGAPSTASRCAHLPRSFPKIGCTFPFHWVGRKDALKSRITAVKLLMRWRTVGVGIHTRCNPRRGLAWFAFNLIPVVYTPVHGGHGRPAQKHRPGVLQVERIWQSLKCQFLLQRLPSPAESEMVNSSSHSQSRFNLPLHGRRLTPWTARPWNGLSPLECSRPLTHSVRP